MATPHEVLWMGFDGLDDVERPVGVRPGGVVLFAKNLDPDPVTGPARCHALVRRLRERWAPLAVAMDQEGGAVSRLKAWVGPTPTFEAIWRRDGSEGCRAWGALWGEGLARLGIPVDFAPVADLSDGRMDTGLGERRASADPAEVATAVGAFLAGLESTGVRGCLKHFPGLGGSAVDSHKALPEVPDPEQAARNAQPFQQLAHDDRLVMVGHVRTPWSGPLPASLHRGSVAENPWGVRGRFIPDALEMGGCTDWDWPARVRLALEAGHEALLVCMPAAQVEACTAALEALPESLWRPAAERFAALRRNLDTPMPAWDPRGWADWVDRVRAASVGVAASRPADPTEVR